MNSLLRIVPFVGLVLGSTAVAEEPSEIPKYEQCVLMPSEYVDSATELLTVGLSTSTWCDLCGDSKPGDIEVISEIEFLEHDDNFHVVKMNGRVIDAAYLYFYNKGVFTNLGTYYYCNPVGVDRNIYAWSHILNEVKRLNRERARLEFTSRKSK